MWELWNPRELHRTTENQTGKILEIEVIASRDVGFRCYPQAVHLEVDLDRTPQEDM